MKKVLGLILFAMLLFGGCQDDNSILEPTDALSQASPITKGRTILPKFITLPGQDGLAKLIDGIGGWRVEKLVPSDKDTELIILEEYTGGIHGKVKIEVKLLVYKGTVKEDAYVAMYVDNEYGTVTFKASEVFNKEARLLVKYEGLDLDNILAEDISFGFVDREGYIDQANFKEIKFESGKGYLELCEGMVTNFTQYGFTTTK